MKLPKFPIDKSVPMEKAKEPDADMTFENIVTLGTLTAMAADSCEVTQVGVNATAVSPMPTCSSLNEYITLASCLEWGINQLCLMPMTALL